MNGIFVAVILFIIVLSIPYAYQQGIRVCLDSCGDFVAVCRSGDTMLVPAACSCGVDASFLTGAGWEFCNV